MIQLVVHDYCHVCSQFEPASVSQWDYNVEGCKRHFVSCVHHAACAYTEERVREEIRKEEKEKK